jgi:hypothetical protein
MSQATEMGKTLFLNQVGDDTPKRAFRITGGKGFHMYFANGHLVSVQWGPGNYCDYYDDVLTRPENEPFQKYVARLGAEGSDTAEIMAPSADYAIPNDEWKDSVEGYLAPEDVLNHMVRTAMMGSRWYRLKCWVWDLMRPMATEEN